MRRSAPRPLGDALEGVLRRAQPASPLAGIQAAWEAAAGERIAREATPVSERDGVVTVACSSALWAHELELLGGDLRGRLEAAIGASGGGPAVRSLRFVVRA
jgi:predicted nucleic acid-binding Zn ribbon protein